MGLLNKEKEKWLIEAQRSMPPYYEEAAKQAKSMRVWVCVYVKEKQSLPEARQPLLKRSSTYFPVSEQGNGHLRAGADL